MKTYIRQIFATVALIAGLQQAFAQGTAFTYQGRFNDGAIPATGRYDLKFTIFDSTNNPGVVIAGPLTNSATAISNGVFTVTVDFGSGVFSGPDRWLEIGARTNLGGSGTFITLSPRTKLTPTPYAITAGNLTGVVPGTGISGTYSSAVTLNNPLNSFFGNGGGLTNVNAATLGGFNYCSLPCYWNLSGNAGTTPGVNFLGTTDNQALTLRVNNTVALQYQPGTTLPNVVAGLASFHPSVIASGVSGAVIAGGNAPSGGVTGFGGGDFMAVYDNDGAIGGGFGNKVGSNNGDITDGAFATVGGGVFNGAANYAATVAGGDGNLAGGQRSFIGGGFANQALAGFSVLGGGLQNTINTIADYATIGGGNNNTIQSNSPNTTISGGYLNSVQLISPYSTIGGGSNNVTQFSTDASTIGGGAGNTIQSNAANSVIGGGNLNTVRIYSGYSVIGGGYANAVTGGFATIAGGRENFCDGFSTVGGGYANSASGPGATVGGGEQNTVNYTGATIGGGLNNSSLGLASTVGGGDVNSAFGQFATIAGGYHNAAGPGEFPAVGGGAYNISGGWYATVPGGASNSAAADNSFAAGTQAAANHRGSFVWSDAQGGVFASSANDQVSFRCLGGVRFTSGSGGVNQTVSWAPGSGSWSFSSDRSLKEEFKSVDTRAVLEKVAGLPISEWNYTGYPQRHIGVMAQDFHAAFPLNESTTTLNDADLHGVTLAAIQGLDRKLADESSSLRDQVKARDERIVALEKSVAELKKLVVELQQSRSAINR